MSENPTEGREERWSEARTPERDTDGQPDPDGSRLVNEQNDEPDVYLDIPSLKVDELSINVEDLRARISVQSEVLDLLKLNVGVDATLKKSVIELKGVEAQALLTARLDNVAAIVDRVLTTIDRNPEILKHITRGVGSATRNDSATRNRGEDLRPEAFEVTEDVEATKDVAGDDRVADSTNETSDRSDQDASRPEAMEEAEAEHGVRSGSAQRRDPARPRRVPAERRPLSRWFSGRSG